MHCGDKHRHTKRRGKARFCTWCGEEIKIGEVYETWLYFDGGSRMSVYAHEECAEAWDEAAREEGGIVEVGHGDMERPTK